MTILVPDHGQQHIEALLTEFHPGAHPLTKDIMASLGSQARAHVVSYVREEAERRIQIGMALRHVFSVVTERSRGLLSGAEVVFHEATALWPKTDSWSLFRRLLETLEPDPPDWESSIAGRFDTLMSGPARRIAGLPDETGLAEGTGEDT